jgi:VanZ family protein
LFRLAFWAAALFAFVMAVLPQPPSVDVSDKVEHMAAFFVITVLGCSAYPNVSRVKLALALVAFGGLIELVQEFPMFHRDSELSDWLADILAVVIALASVWLVKRLRTAGAE